MSSFTEAPTLSTLLSRSQSEMDSGSYSEALSTLEELSLGVSQASLFSPGDESDDVATSSLPFLLVPYRTAKAHSGARTDGPEGRLGALGRAAACYVRFLGDLEGMGMLGEEEGDAYRRSVEREGEWVEVSREEKMGRFKAGRELDGEIGRLEAVLKRRERMGLAEGEEVDGGDEEATRRELHLKTIRRAAIDSVEEIVAMGREREMLKMMLERSSSAGAGGEEERRRREEDARRQQQRRQQADARSPGRGPMLTRIERDPRTQQLHVFQREEVQKGVFRPGWNLPTMTLEELGDIEYAEAVAREAAQKEAEKDRKLQPRRMEYLVKDGLEDDAELVDKSAALDRAWDNWKDENPKGIGNKMADVGDRNF